MRFKRRHPAVRSLCRFDWNNGRGSRIRNNVRQSDIMIEADVRRRNDSLPPVICFSGHRQNWLPREYRIAFRRRSRIGNTRVERRQIFFRRIRDHRGAVELRIHCDVLPIHPCRRQHPEHCQCARVKHDRLKKTSPRHSPSNKDIAPDAKFAFPQRTYRPHRGGDAAPKGATARFQFDQKVQGIHVRAVNLRVQNLHSANSFGGSLVRWDAKRLPAIASDGYSVTKIIADRQGMAR